jgi:hypothetical protein
MSDILFGLGLAISQMINPDKVISSQVTGSVTCLGALCGLERFGIGFLLYK